MRGTGLGSCHTGLCNSKRTPSPGAAAASNAGPVARLPGWSCWTQPTHWRTEVAEIAAADPGQLELDLQVAGPGLGAVLVLVDFLGLRVLKVLLWALVG